MDQDTITWMWILGGLVLAVSEAVVPGLVVIFMGTAGMLVGALNALGLVHSLGVSLALWMASSVGLLLTVRKSALRFFPSETTFAPHRPDVDAMGQLVEVLEDVGLEGKPGRIRFEGTTWPALTQGGEPIKKGQAARLVVRDNLVWMVEPVTPEELAEAAEEKKLGTGSDEKN